MIYFSQLIIRHCDTIMMWWLLGKGGQVVDVHMDVDDAALLFTTLLSVLFASFLSLKKGKPILPVLNISLVMNEVILGE